MNKEELTTFDVQTKLESAKLMHNDKLEFNKLGSSRRTFFELLIVCIYFSCAALYLTVMPESETNNSILMVLFYTVIGLIVFISMTTTRIHKRIDLLAKINGQGQEKVN